MWEHNLVKFPELELPEFEMPERSLLYGIPAMGGEAGQIEGQRSYLVRVARAHSVNPRLLIRKVFAGSNPVFEQLRYARFFSKYAGTIDGLGKYAELFHDEIGRLTGVSFLRHMSLLSLRELLPPNGAGLLAHKPKWCSRCVGEMVESGDDVYRPLVWSLELYRVCTKHGIFLRETCGHCGRTQPFIPRYPDLGRCYHCGKSLSEGEIHQSTEELDLWVSAAVSDLVQHLPEIDGLATVKRFVSIMKGAEKSVAGGNRAQFCKLIGLPRWTFTGWLAKGEKPSLPQFLAVCYGLNLMPSELLLSKPERVLSAGDVRPIPGRFIEREERPLLSAKKRQRLAKELAGIVKDPADARTLLAIAKSIGITTSCMKYWFSEECEMILGRHEEARKSQVAARLKVDRETVINVVRDIRERGEYPSIRKVNAVLQGHKLLLARKELLCVYRDEKKKPSN